MRKYVIADIILTRELYERTLRFDLIKSINKEYGNGCYVSVKNGGEIVAWLDVRYRTDTNLLSIAFDYITSHYGKHWQSFTLREIDAETKTYTVMQSYYQ